MRVLILTATLALSATTAANAAQFVTNGGFESTLLAQSSEFGDRFPSQQVTGWSTSGYNWVFRPGEADTVGGNGEYSFLSLHGPGNGSANGLTTSPFGATSSRPTVRFPPPRSRSSSAA